MLKYRGGAVCAKYIQIPNPSNTSVYLGVDKSITTTGTDAATARLWIWDDSYTDAATFKAAMSGVMLYYELAEPIEVDFEEQNMAYQVNDYGTEQLLPENTSVPTTTPIMLDVTYGNIPNTIVNINNTTYSKTEVDNALNTKQASLVSGTNIKTINGESILGSGNIIVSGNEGLYEKQLDTSNLISNTYIETNGVETAYSNWSSTNFIDISDGTYIKADRSLEFSAFYDSTQTFISRAKLSTNYLVIPENAKYVRVSGRTSDMNAATVTILATGSSSGGEANVIESVKVNGTALTVTNKAVDITAVPASIVTQDATHRFVSDTEKSTWNNAGNIYYTDDSWIKDSSNNTLSDYSVITQLDRIIDQNNNVYYCVGVNSNNLIFRTVDEEGAPSAGYEIDVNNNEVLTLSSIEYLTSSDIPTLSKGTTTGSGNAVTDISVSGHTITLTKGTEFLTTGASSDDILYDPSVSADTSTIGPGLLTTCLEDIDDALDTKQNTSDKVTSISSSSTNTQYPSALAVYNFGTNLVG